MSRIKICGLTRDCDIDYVNEAKPDYIGFVFAESRRHISTDSAKDFKSRLLSSIITVGVFVNSPTNDIIRLCGDGVIDMVQLHGSEDAGYIENLKKNVSTPVIKAVRMDCAASALSWLHSPADFLLLDNGGGGTGRAFDWKLIPDTDKPFFLAGGVSEDNLAEALALRPYCIDVSSGAETDGVKDRDKILRLVKKVREG